ncbi:hypothetical protein KP79_PYT05582 [Mizuhopecten yessoensis]|uniref:Uncharacterized protein n=1 Tax=Mizuhopecten yessoensis TaxID=6573 RepID=A0A210QIX8_MIZYE|nr:hypothetical protein KP79_PYT05582 [Mizuhopecten yessoensis]
MMTRYFWHVVNLFLIFFTTVVVSDGIYTADRQYDAILSGNCNIAFRQADVTLYRKITTGSRNKLVYVHFQFTHVVTLPEEKHGDLFEPLTWIHVSGHQGKALLKLLHQYEALSLQTMSIGVEHINFDVTESRTGCLTNQPMSVLGPFFRDILLDNFDRSLKTDKLPALKNKLEASSEPTRKGKLCYMTIGRDGDNAKFPYICCNKNKDGDAVCRELTVDKWMKLVLLFIRTINVLVFAFCPLLVPESYYNDTKESVLYQNNFLTKRKHIKVLKTSVGKRAISRSNILTERFVDKYMPKLSKAVHTMKLDEPYECDTGTIEFMVNCRDLVNDNDVPVGIFSTIYNGLARCEVRHYHSMLECCNGNLLGELSPVSCSLLWHECLSHLMTVVVVFLMATPWITRVIFYTLYEKDHFEKRKMAAESRDLRAPYIGNFTLYLSPSHVTFIICYFVIIMESLYFGLLKTNVAKSIQSMLRQCFQDMRNTCRIKFGGAFFKLLLKPCYKFGILGLVLFPLFWALVMPLLLVRILFYFVPIFNLTVRLLGSLINYLFPTKSVLIQDAIQLWSNLIGTDSSTSMTGQSESGRRPSKVSCLTKFRRVVMTMVYLLGLYSFLFLLVEFVKFVVAIAIYTLMGIILNPSYAMQYVPLLFMIAVYCHTTFGGVYKKYRVFNKIIHKHLLETLNDASSTGQSELMTANSNTAFEIHQEIGDNSMNTFSVKNSNIMWCSSRIVLFVDKHGTLYIRRNFFFQCCEMDHFAAPGTLLSNLSKAIFRFLLIIVFLMFVGLVVTAFSEEFELSLTNQTFITIAGGLIPFVLTNFLFRNVELPTVEEKDVRFKRCLNEIISKYVERFPVVDIECKPLTYSDSQQNTRKLNETSPNSAGSGDHVIVICDDVMDLSSKTRSCSSSGFGNLKYAEDSDQYQKEDKEQVINEKTVQCREDESTAKHQKKSNSKNIQNGVEEIISDHSASKVELLDTNEVPVGKEARKVQDNPKRANVGGRVNTEFQLQDYDLVIDVRKEKSVKQYFRSLI